MILLMTFIKHILKGIIPILHKFFQKIQKEMPYPYSFSEANITLIPKPDEVIIRKGDYRPMSLST